MSDVFLVEDGDLAPASEPLVDLSDGTTDDGQDSPGGSAPARRALRRRLWWAAALVVVVGVGSVVGVGQYQENQRRDRLAATSGLVGSLETPLHELWRTPGAAGGPVDATAIVTWGPLHRARGMLVATGIQANGLVRAVGLDPGTGATVWSTTLTPESGSPTLPDCVAPRPDGTSAAGSAAQVVACLVKNRLVDPTPALDGSAPLVALSTTALVVLDPATGAVLHEREVPAGTMIATIGPDVVIAQTTGRSLTVTRIDPDAGTDRWVYSTTLDRSSLFSSVTMTATADAVFLAISDRGWQISADGTLRDSREFGAVGDSQWYEPVTGGRVVQWSLRLSSGTAQGTVINAAGRSAETPLAIDGFPLAATVDDGSDAGIVFAGSLGADVLSAWDLSTLDNRWHADVAVRSAPAVIDGRVVVGAAEGLRVLDSHSGEDLWETSSPSPTDRSFVTDGDAVAVLEEVGGTHRAIRTYALDNGAKRWVISVDDAVDSLVQYDGLVVGLTAQGLIAYGSA